MKEVSNPGMKNRNRPPVQCLLRYCLPIFVAFFAAGYLIDTHMERDSALPSRFQASPAKPAAEKPFKSIFIGEARIRLAMFLTDRPTARVLDSITNLPAGIREHLPDTADAGEPFSPGCIRIYAGHRFLTAIKNHNKYVVATENGGALYNWSMIGFTVDESGRVIQQIGRIEEGDYVILGDK